MKELRKKNHRLRMQVVKMHYECVGHSLLHVLLTLCYRVVTALTGHVHS